MNNEKLLTILVPCYNSAAYMRHCIDSLLPGGDLMDIIVVDDGSIDDTGKIADEYAAKYPHMIRAIQQENGGHGEGINQGVAHAVGKYFKVIDSDDWTDTESLTKVLDFLQKNDVDLLVTNYVYEHDDPSTNSTIRFKNVFRPEGKVMTWEDTHAFGPTQYLTLHSTIYRTEVIRQTGIVLPKKVFYEDNLFVYTPLPYVKKLAYLNVDFYHYYIGRPDQSVNLDVMKKRCHHQIQISEEIFTKHDLSHIKMQNPKLARYMYHKVVLVMVIATVFTRQNKTEEAEEQIRQMWVNVAKVYPELAKKVRYRSIAAFVNIPGKIGNRICCGLYDIGHKIVKFN